MDTNKNVIIRKENIKRLIKDIKQIKNDPLDAHGIYYVHDDSDMLKGYCLICGPKDTPYFGGYYFFELFYPPEYPHAPPKVIYSTNAEKIRFNPNLYTNGKVCISLLNTWRGEQWTSCQTITSILLTLCSLLNNYPLLNEPGITSKHKDFKSYNEIIAFKNIDIAICKILNKSPDIYHQYFQYFDEAIISNFKKNKDKINEYIKKMLSTEPYICKTGLYNMKVNIDYSFLNEQYNEVIKIIN